MGFKDFLEKQVIIARLKTVSGNRKSFISTATATVAFQELDKRATTEIDMVQDRAWIMYAAIEDDYKIQEGDRITLSGVNYIVLEKTKKDYMGSPNMHLEVILVDHESDE